MKALPLLTLLLLVVQIASAQETPESTDWTTEQRCITAPSRPPEGWTYDGVIFTFTPGDGVHARRADMSTPYYVAFDGNTEFAGAGRISPDGKWFATPVGNIAFRTDIDAIYIGTAVRVYSTSPSHEMYQITIRRRDRTFSSQGLTPIVWLDDEHFVTQALPEGYFEGNEPYLVNPFEGTVSQVALELDYRGTYSLAERQLLDMIPADRGIVNVDFSHDQSSLAYSDYAETIHIADFETRTITDTCIQTPYSIALSPDGRQLAFGLEPAGYVYILDLEAWEAYRIDLAAADVIGWYPLE